MKYKIKVKLTPQGFSTVLYKKILFVWIAIDGLRPLGIAYFWIDEFIERCRTLYGDKLLINDDRPENLKNQCKK